MAHIRHVKLRSGDRWHVMYRINKRSVTDTFINPKGAVEFAGLVDSIGGEAAREVLHARRGSAQAGKIPTIAQALTEHIDNLTGVTEGTRRDYRKMAALIAKSALGPLPVDAVTPVAVGKWVDSQRAQVSAKTIRNRHGLLFAAMAAQVDKGNIASNPCAKTKIGRTERGEMTILSRDELAAVVDAIGQHWRPLVITLAGTGLRFGEATALQVRDIDLDADTPVLRVARSWKHTDGPERELGPPKSEKGRRLVSLPPEVVAAVRPLVVGKSRDAFVFTNTVGAPIRQNSFHEIWTAAVVRSGVGKKPRVHDLRHSHVASQIAQGVPLPVIQRRLGHEQITTTIDTYGHMADDALSVAAQAASMFLSPSVPELEPHVEPELQVLEAGRD